MALYVIGDTHLSLGSDKPMDVFGGSWTGYVDKLRAGFAQVGPEDTVVICGDMNVAHQEIDLKNPKTNRGNAGFSDQERGKMTELLDSGFIDTFRWLHPDLTGAYTWWSYMFHAREKNAGWRIDYFLVSERLRDQVQASEIHAEVMGSDHCPVELLLQDASGGKRLSV